MSWVNHLCLHVNYNWGWSTISFSKYYISWKPSRKSLSVQIFVLNGSLLNINFCLIQEKVIIVSSYSRSTNLHSKLWPSSELLPQIRNFMETIELWTSCFRVFRLMHKLGQRKISIHDVLDREYRYWIASYLLSQTCIVSPNLGTKFVIVGAFLTLTSYSMFFQRSSFSRNVFFWILSRLMLRKTINLLYLWDVTRMCSLRNNSRE